MHVMPLQTKLMPWHWLTKTFRENYLITGHTFRFCNLRFPAKVTTWYDVISFGSSFFFNSARSREYGTTSRIFGWLHLKKFKKFKMLLLHTMILSITSSICAKLWYVGVHCKCLQGFTGTLQGKSECLDFKFMGIVCIPAIPVIFGVNQKKCGLFIYTLY